MNGVRKMTMLVVIVAASFFVETANAQFEPQPLPQFVPDMFPARQPVFGPSGREMLDGARGVQWIVVPAGKSMKMEFRSNAHWVNKLILYDENGREFASRANYLQGGMAPIEFRNNGNGSRYFYLTSWAQNSKYDHKFPWRPWYQSGLKNLGMGIFGVCDGGVFPPNETAFRAVIVRVTIY